MGSITKASKTDKDGKKVTTYRAFIRRTVNGKSVSKTKMCASKAEAEGWIRNNESDAALKQLGKVKGPTFADVVETFTRTPPDSGTKFWDAGHLEFWVSELGAMKTGNITLAEINACKARLQVKPAVRKTLTGVKETGKPITPATVNRYLASLSSVFNFALARGIVTAHPMKGGAVRKLTESKGRRRILTSVEEQRLYDAARGSRWPQMHLFLRVCLTTAARKSEVLQMRWQYVDLDRSVAMLPTSKNDEPRAMPLVADVKAALAEAKKVRPLTSDYVFFDPKRPERPKNIDMTWRHVRERAGLLNDRDDPLDRVVLHSTRHTVATRLVRVEKNLARVQNVTGHKTLSQLSKYTHLDTDEAVALAQRVLGGAA